MNERNYKMTNTCKNSLFKKPNSVEINFCKKFPAGCCQPHLLRIEPVANASSCQVKMIGLTICFIQFICNNCMISFISATHTTFGCSSDLKIQFYNNIIDASGCVKVS